MILPFAQHLPCVASRLVECDAVLFGVEASFEVVAVRQLHYDRDRKSDARMPAVVKVVPIVIVDVDVIGIVPVLCPVFRPGIHEQERKAAVREARIPHVDRGAVVNPEPVLTPEMEIEAGLRNVVTAVASTLRPGAMLAFPPLSTILLPCTMFLPAAALV